MKSFLLCLSGRKSLQKAQRALEGLGVEGIYTLQEGEQVFIGGIAKKIPQIEGALLIEEGSPKIDWEKQWSLFAENYKEGKAHINLAPFGKKKTLLLLPGPGFGDLSHPTTRLMLEMMKGKIKGESIVDVGSGSGILALSALLLGARCARGLEIDPAALTHARKNAKLNHLEKKAIFSKELPKKMEETHLFLMNMILPEQKVLEPSRFNKWAKFWIVSGILAKQKRTYLSLAKKWSWTPISEHKRGEWMGWIFSV